MTIRQDFLIRCLRVASLNVTVVLKNLESHYTQAKTAYEQTEHATYHYQLCQLRQDILTLGTFKSLVDKALSTLQEKPGLLPALTPLFMLIYGSLPVNKNILQGLQERFIKLISSDIYIAKKFDSEVWEFLRAEADNHESELFTAAYIEKEKHRPQVRLWACGRVFSEVLFNNSTSLRRLVVDDAQTLQKQMGPAFSYPQHRYVSLSAPVSKLQMKGQLIAYAEEPLKRLQLAMVLPWMEEQLGQTCKIHAFYAAAWAFHLLMPQTTPCPPPVHPQAGLPADKLSLLQQAQKLFSSRIGEVYSPVHLMQLIESNGYNNVRLYHCDSSNYINQLKELIDYGALGLIYFDVNLNLTQPERFGLPCKKGSNYEHSAVVWGYGTTNSGKDLFYVYQWDRYFQFTAEELLSSTDQLERRSGEVFYDLAQEGEEPSWNDLRRINEFQPDLAERIMKKDYRSKLFAPPPPKGLPSFRNCIIGIGPNVQFRQEKAEREYLINRTRS